MSTCGWPVAMMIGGAAFELVGIGLVVLDIRSARRRALEIAPRSFEQALPVTPVMARAVMPWETEGHQPTLEERIERAERAIEQLDARMHARLGDLGTRVSQLTRDVADREWDTHDREEASRAFLRDVLTGDLRRRRYGVVFLAIGIVAALTGNLWALSAC